jgi:hypothetical protein
MKQDTDSERQLWWEIDLEKTRQSTANEQLAGAVNICPITEEKDPPPPPLPSALN